MRLVIQRVSRASVAIEGRTVSGIGNGLLVLVGVETGDTEEDMRWLVGKTVGLRIFNDENGVMNRSVVDVGGEVLAVSQFTLTASPRKGTALPTFVPQATIWQSRCTRSTARKSRRRSASRSAKEYSARICRSPLSTMAR